jgi:hypothetical protein
LDKSQDDSMRQHVTAAGNTALVPAFSSPQPNAEPATGPAPPAVKPPGGVDTLATLEDIYEQRDDRWLVQTKLDQPSIKIGGNLTFSVRSNRNGYVYLFYRGSQPDSFYLLFPNQLDKSNAIAANYELHLPRQEWSVTALGPKGTDHILVMVAETERDFSALSLPAEYVSSAGPFGKIKPTPQAAARIGQIATLSAALRNPQCNGTGTARDLGVARTCSNVFGADLVSVEETE